MATVIESLIVTLGLDTTNFRRGTADATRARNTLGDTNRRQDAETSAREKKLAAEQARRGKEADARAKAMADGFRKVRNEALSLFALFTAGVGIKNFIANTVESAVQLGYLSQNLKVSIESLQAYGRAAERAGGTTEGAFAQLRESADSLAALRSGLGPNEGMQWFFRMGGSSDDLKDGNTYLMARAKIVHDMFSVDPQRAMLISKQMGISEDQFNLIKQGPDAIRELVEAQKKLSSITEEDARGAKKLKDQWLDFTQGLTATTTKIVVALIPAFSQLMNWLQTVAGWVTDNKDLIGAWVTDFVTKAIPVMQKIGRFLADLDWDGAANRLKLVGDAIVKIADALSTVIDLWNEWIGKKGEKGKIGVKVEKAIDPKGDLSAYYGPDEVAKDNARKKAGQPSKYSAVDYFVKRMEARFGNQAAKEFIRDSTGVDEFGAGKATAQPQGNANFSALEKKYGLPNGLLDAVWLQESSRGKNMLSPKGAQGHFGFMPGTQAQYGLKNPNDLAESSDAAARMYRDLLKENNGNLPAALAGYNWGSGNLKKKGIGAAPKETRDYIDSVMGRVGAGAAATRGGPQSSNSKTDVSVGQVTINTQATDAKGIAMSIGPAIGQQFSWADQANTGFA